MSEEEIEALARTVKLCEDDVIGASAAERPIALVSYYLAFERLRYAIALGYGRERAGEMKIAQIRSASRVR